MEKETERQRDCEETESKKERKGERDGEMDRKIRKQKEGGATVQPE